MDTNNQISMHDIKQTIGALSEKLKDCSNIELLCAGIILAKDFKNIDKPLEMIKLARRINLKGEENQNLDVVNIMAPFIHSIINETYQEGQIQDQVAE